MSDVGKLNRSNSTDSSEPETRLWCYLIYRVLFFKYSSPIQVFFTWKPNPCTSRSCLCQALGHNRTRHWVWQSQYNYFWPHAIPESLPVLSISLSQAMEMVFFWKRYMQCCTTEYRGFLPNTAAASDSRAPFNLTEVITWPHPKCLKFTLTECVLTVMW